MMQEATEILLKKIDLTPPQMQAVMEEIMRGGAQTEEIVSFLAALSNKGETVDEIAAAVSVMRQHASRIHVNDSIVLDTCGTGGDKKGTFNVSTIAAFVASASGITVAKYGNRSVSSRSGSADILEALGVNINMEPQALEKCLNNIGIAFLFAQKLHPAMKFAMPARKQIGAKTIFNILGPLSNPAGATHQLVGVYDRRLTQVLARVLGKLGCAHALVVHGEDGLDEITTTGETFISESINGKITDYKISPLNFGLKIAGLEDLLGGTAQDNAKILIDCLNGKTGPARDIVVLNAACAIYAADKVKSIKEGIKLAQDSIDSKKALQKLELLKDYSNKTDI
jgi:anthranilate phosphoribosyltransferase